MHHCSCHRTEDFETPHCGLTRIFHAPHETPTARSAGLRPGVAHPAGKRRVGDRRPRGHEMSGLSGCPVFSYYSEMPDDPGECLLKLFYRNILESRPLCASCSRSCLRGRYGENRLRSGMAGMSVDDGHHHSTHCHRKRPILPVNALAWGLEGSPLPQNPPGEPGEVNLFCGSSRRVQGVHTGCTRAAHPFPAWASLELPLCTPCTRREDGAGKARKSGFNNGLRLVHLFA
jgi:hypothetical protein